MVICVLFFGCGGPQKESEGKSSGQGSGTMVREDAEGLVRISVVKGRGELTLDLDKWDSLYRAFEDFNDTKFYKGPFKIETRQDIAIVDAYVGKVRDLRFYYDKIPLLYVVLLMENGSIECNELRPYFTSVEDSFSTMGPLPWLSKINAIYGENNTVYAKDVSGVKFDMYIPLAMPYIGKKVWATTLQAGGSPEYTGEITFTGEDSLSYEIRSGAGASLVYSGFYRMILNEEDEAAFPANSLQLALYRELQRGSSDAVMRAIPMEIETVYGVGVNLADGSIRLQHIDGDYLFSHNGANQEQLTMEPPYEGAPSVYPYEMVDFLTGSWEFLLSGYNYGCKLDVYYSNFNQYALDYSFFFLDSESRLELSEFKGGLSSGVDYTYGETSTLTLHYYGYGLENETYAIKDSGIHRGRRMMILFPDAFLIQPIFDKLELSDRYGYIHIPLAFAKESGEKRTGRKIINETFNAVFWEFDTSQNTVWVTEGGLSGDDPFCVSVEYKVSGVEDWIILEALPGMDCFIRTDANGEVVEFILPMG